MSMYYLHRAGETKGPYAPGRLRQMWTAGEIGPDDLVCEHGTEEWLPAEAIAAPTTEELRETRAPVRRAECSTGRAALAVLMLLLGVLALFLACGFWPLLFLGPGLIAGGLLVLRPRHVCGACRNPVERHSLACPHCRTGLVPMKG